MPTILRSFLLAFAFAAIAVGCAGAGTLEDSVTASGLYRGSTTRAPDDRPFPRLAPKRAVRKRTVGERAAAIALKAVGVPYRWGGASPASGFDCSGLVYWAYRHLGIDLPHSSYALYNEGRRVGRSRMKAGDVIFFSGLGHVGMYIGKGRMVHAPSSGRLVEVVRLAGSHYGSRIAGARRIAS